MNVEHLEKISWSRHWGLGHVLDEAIKQGVFWDVVLVLQKIHTAWAWLGLAWTWA